MAGFVWAQILLGIAGGFMAPAVFLTFAWMESVSLPLYGLLITVGLLSGLEIPLIARVLKDIGAPEFRFENVLSVDYIGALVASLAFPLLIIPHLGLMAGSLAFGALNLGVAGLSLWIFRRDTSRAQLGVWAIALLVTLVEPAALPAKRLCGASGGHAARHCGAMPTSSAHALPPGCWPIAYSMAAAYLVRVRVRVRDTVRVRSGVRVRVGVARWPRRTPSAREYAQPHR